MKLSIKTRLLPFSHQPGVRLLLPRTVLEAVVYPSRIELYDINDLSLAGTIDFQIPSIVEGFTCIQDLERGYLRGFGKTSLGFFRWRLEADDAGFSLRFEKGEMPFFIKVIKEVKPLLTSLPGFERLSLGINKAQEMEKIFMRQDPKEILPFWLRIGELHSSTASSCNIQEGHKTLSGLMQLWKKHFLPFFCPRKLDTRFLGAVSNDLSVQPLELLSYSSEVIRTFFIQENEGGIDVLPSLPKEFHSGRWMHIRLKRPLILHMEWSKKAIRRLFIESLEDQEVVFFFNGGVKRCRSSLGKEISSGEIVSLKAKEHYLFDRFQR